MSTTIDQRIVEMRFDNKQFEQNVSTTMSSLDKLKQKLKLDGVSKGLEDVNAAAGRVDMSTLSNSVDKVGLKFSGLWTIADQALRNITNSAMNAGTRIIKALTIDPVKAGFSEYETQLNAVQTILANTESKGKTLNDVNSALDELNTYADKTIYNFTEMTRNIGTFTAAGVDLDTSVSAIKGIANLAAVSGSTSQQASTAMYQLSQAMASGTVKLMDWNSVVNAGMGGQVFQDALKETAKVHGIAIDDIIKKQGSFRESLSEGWLTTEILTDTLAKFTGDLSEEQLKSQGYTEAQIKEIMKLGQTANDAATKVKTFTQLFDTLKEAAQSGWTQTWEILVGDFEEAKTLLTQISDVIGGVIGKSAESRNELLENWKVMGGRDDLIESFKNAFEALVSIITPIKEAFREIFPPTTAEQLVKITEGLKNFTAKLKLSDKNGEKLKRTFKGIFAVLSIFGEIISAAVKAVVSLFGGVGDLGGSILDVTAAIGDWLVSFAEVIRSGGVINKVFQGLTKVFKFVINIISSLFEGFVSLFDGMSLIGDSAEGAKSGVVSAFEAMGSALENCSLFKIMKGVWNLITSIASGIVKVVGTITSGLASRLGNANFGGIFELINSISVSAIAIFFAKFVKGFSDVVDSVGDFKESALDILDSVRGCFEAYQNQLRAGTLLKIAGAIAILAAALIALSLVDSDKLSGAIAAITVLFAELMLAMSVFSKMAGNFQGVGKATTAMLGISIAILILSSALKSIADLKFGELVVGLLGVAGLAAIIVAVAKLLSSSEKTVLKGATQMVIFAAAIKILASVCKDLAMLKWDELAKGLIGVGVLLAEVALFMNTAKFSGKTITTATGIVILAAAIKVLASACKDFAYMSWGELGKGLATIAVLLAEIALFTKLTANATKVISTGVAMIALAAAMKIFASAIRDMGSMSWTELAKGLLGMAGALAAIAIALKFMPTNMVSSGIGLIAISTALVIMASALNKMGGMSWESVAKGLVTLGGSMLILAVGLHAMRNTLSGSAALLVAAASLAILTPVLTTLGKMSWGSIAKGLLAIAGAFAVIGVAGLLLSPIIPAILALAGAMALIGVGMLAAGLGLAAFGSGLSILAVGFTALIASLSAIASGIITLVSSLVVGIVKGLGEGIVAFCEIIIDGAPVIGEAIKQVVITLCGVLVECVPLIADTCLQLIVGILGSLVEYTPQIVDSLFQFIIGILNGISSNIPALIQAVVDIFVSIFQGAVDALGSIDPSSLIQGIAAVGLMAGLVAALAGIAALTPLAMVGVLGLGAVVTELAIVLSAIGALAQIPGLEWLITEGGDFLQVIGTAIGQFIGGIAGGIAQGITGSLPQIGTDLSTFMTNLQPFIEGAKLIDESVISGVKSLVGVILAITAANVLEGLASWITGGSSIASFAAELPILGAGLKGFSDAVTGIVPENILAAVDAAKALAEMTAIIPNEGGVVGWFAGENSIAKFGAELPALGQGLKGFSDAVTGIVPENIVAAANAAKVLAEMTSTIPNEGGVASWFAGENSISKFAGDIVTLGAGIKGFSDAVVGVVPENVIAAANAAKVLSDMTSSIPNEGGVAAWFAGENSISKFAGDIVTLGHGLKGFSDAVVGVVPENVVAAANAAKTLADMTSAIPNEGGVKAWFVGESSISGFAHQLPILGAGLKGFSDAVVGIVPESVVAAASAAKSLAQMTTYIPNEGGIKSWFTGESGVAKFSGDLVTLGKGLKGFSNETTGINPESVTAAANAAKSLAQMTSYIPNEGGIKAWFTGESSISNFAGKLPALGKGLKGFSDSTAGINPETMTAAANAAKSLAEMTSHIPKEGGIKAWFTGETSVSNFANKLPTLGKGLTEFSKSVAGINPTNITAAADAANSLAKMTDTVPKDTSKIVKFGENLVKFGSSLSSYFTKMKGVSSGSVASSANAVDAVKDIASINVSNITSLSKAIDKVTDSIKNLSKVPKDSLSSFSKALKDLGKKSADAFVDAFDNLDSDLKKQAKSAMDAFVNGVEGQKSKAKSAFTRIVDACADAISNKSTAFRSAGKNLAQGLADGISANSYRAEAKAKAMADAAVKAAKKALDINSPSKVFYDVGEYTGEGFVLGLDSYGAASYNAGSEMADSARSGLSDAISKIRDFIHGDMDMQPTIRPVLDLSDVKSGASSIGKMFSSKSSLGVMANVGAISSAMSRRNQNGANDDVVSAIKGLTKDLEKNRGDTYSIGNISYGDDSSVAEAIQALIRAAIIERRV